MVSKEDKVPGTGGVIFKRKGGEVAAPYAGQQDEEKPGALPGREGVPGAEEELLKAGKVPLHPAMIRAPASVLGRIGTELTGYPGFTFTEQELNDLAEVWVMTGVEMSPMLQATITTTSLFGFKSLGYFAWAKAGKPQVPGAKAIGEETTAPTGEE